MKLTAIFKKVPGGYIGFVEELPGGKYARPHIARDSIKSERSNRACARSESYFG